MLNNQKLANYAVTGAFGYSGRYIAKRMLADGYNVRTLTNTPNPSHLFEDRVQTNL